MSCCHRIIVCNFYAQNPTAELQKLKPSTSTRKVYKRGRKRVDARGRRIEILGEIDDGAAFGNQDDIRDDELKDDDDGADETNDDPAY